MTRFLPLIVMTVGALLIAAGASWIYPPAGLVVLGCWMVAVAWPEKGGDAG